MTLTEFLLARIAEDERAAHYAQTRDAVGDRDWAGWWLGHYQHYSRHDPDRVLADCAAKRQIISLARQCEREGYENAAAYLRDAVRSFAAVQADHPDFREEWL